jgi:metal-dependent hydrolase (beta-lactamase superfamily II)
VERQFGCRHKPLGTVPPASSLAAPTGRDRSHRKMPRDPTILSSGHALQSSPSPHAVKTARSRRRLPLSRRRRASWPLPLRWNAVPNRLPALSRRVRRGTPLYIGGEEAFCARVHGVSADGASFGELRRTDLLARDLDLQIGPIAQIVANAAFTTGRIPLVSPERPRVPTSMLPGRGCRRADLDPDRRHLDVFPDDAVHELGTAFHLRGKGLVVIGSCSHRGIINTVLAAQAASGVDRVYAIAGGFHLCASADSRAGIAGSRIDARIESQLHLARPLHGRGVHCASDRADARQGVSNGGWQPNRAWLGHTSGFARLAHR